MADDRCDLLCLDLSRAEAIRATLSADTARDAAMRSRALGDVTRITVALALQAGGELCVCDLAWIAERAENLVGHHLRVLRDSGLARSRREGKIVFYSLTANGDQLLDTLLELHSAHREA
jgi:ArsR family transcriptional regulator, lead/cadmium/zinc/bismuth-responsive transcriptional repressor